MYNIFYQNRYILLLNLCLLCFIAGQNLTELTAFDVGIWGYVLSVLTDHYYVIYCMVPILFVVIFRTIKKVSDITLIRYKNRSAMTIALTVRFAGWLVIYFAISLLAVFLIGLRHYPLSVAFDTVPMGIFYNELIEIFNMYTGYFGNSLVAAFCAISYYIFGFTVLASLLIFINWKFGSKGIIPAVIIVYVLMLIGFKTNLKSQIPFIFLSNYIILHHGLFVNGIIKFIVTVAVGSLILLYCFGIRIPVKKRLSKSIFITQKEIVISFSLLIAIFAAEFISKAAFVDISSWDKVVSLFFGAGKTSGSLISWIKVIIIYMIPLYIAGSSTQKFQQYANASVIIRFKSRRAAHQSLINKNLWFFICYAVAIWLIGIIIYYIGNGMSDLEDMDKSYAVLESIKMWNIYIVIFFINVLCDFVLFRFLAKFTGTVMSFSIIIIYKYFGYLFKICLPSIGYGLIHLCEYEMGVNNFDTSFIITVIIPAVYFLIIAMRWLYYGNHTNRKHKQKI